MKEQKVVYYASGENRGTYDPHCFLENFTGDLNEKTHKFMNWDFDMPVEVPMYEIRTISMPEWMDEQDFKYHHVPLKFASALAGSEIVLSMTRNQFMNFIRLGEKKQYWYGWAKKSKNEFIQSLVEQFEKWLSGESDFQAPLSEKQWMAGIKYCPLWKAAGISKSAYYSR